MYFPVSFHTPQKNNNPQLMTQQFGLKNVMLSYTAVCIYWVTLLPASQQNIITSGIENHFNMHKNTVDRGNLAYKNLTHNEKARQEKSWCKWLTNVFLISVEAGTFLYFSLVESKVQLAPLESVNWFWISSKFSSHCEAFLTYLNSPPKILPTFSLILKMATLPSGKATSSWLVFINLWSISEFSSLVGPITCNL